MIRKICTPVVLGVLLFVGIAASSAPLQVGISVDSSAIPLLLLVSLDGGMGPFNITVTGLDSRDITYQETARTELRTISVAIPWNRRHLVRVSAEDSAGEKAGTEVECEDRIRQQEPFTLDAARYGALRQAGSWKQLTSLADGKLHAETSASFSRSQDAGDTEKPTKKATAGRAEGSGVQVSAQWPGLYVFQSGVDGPTVEVTISPSESFQLGIRGMIDDYEPRALGFTHMDEILPRMASDGVNAVQFVKKLTMKSVRDSVVHDACPYPDWDEKLACAIRLAKSAGFTVMLRVALWLDAPWPESDATLSALQPSDWAAWFASYGGFVLRYADLAEQNGADIYQFADNLHSTYSHEVEYRNLVKALRSRYPGKLLVSTGPWNRDGLSKVGFWDCLDYIGICGSFHTVGAVPYEVATRMKTDDVYRVYKESFESQVLPIARRFKKQVLCCEAYYQSRVGSTYSPSGIPNWDSPGVDYSFTQPVSFAEQVRGYDAYLRVVSEYAHVFAGMFALQWCLEDPTWPVLWGGGGTHNIYSTPAEGLFSLWWDGLPSPEGVPAAAPDCPLVSEVGGYWTMWTFGGATGVASLGGRTVKTEESGMVGIGPNSPLDVTYSNPGRMFESVCTLLLNFGAPRDLSDYAGILLDASADPAATFQIELDFGEQEWIGSIAPPIEIGQGRATYFVSFDELRVMKDARIQYGLGEKEIGLSEVRGIRVNLLSPRGALHIYDFKPVRDPLVPAAGA